MPQLVTTRLDGSVIWKHCLTHSGKHSAHSGCAAETTTATRLLVHVGKHCQESLKTDDDLTETAVILTKMLGEVILPFIACLLNIVVQNRHTRITFLDLVNNWILLLKKRNWELIWALKTITLIIYTVFKNFILVLFWCSKLK